MRQEYYPVGLFLELKRDEGHDKILGGGLDNI